ncbi:hypothetical protein AURDEDRAFT_178602, partial [Auricularia subglabra TFB-10046 SS5]
MSPLAQDSLLRMPQLAQANLLPNHPVGHLHQQVPDIRQALHRHGRRASRATASQPARREESRDSSSSPPPPATQPPRFNGVRPFPLAKQVAKKREERWNAYKVADNGAIEISSSDEDDRPPINRRHTMPAGKLLPGTHMEGDALVIEDSDDEPAAALAPKAATGNAQAAATAAARPPAAKPPAAAKRPAGVIDLTFSDDEDELLLKDPAPPIPSPSPPPLPPAASPSPPPLPPAASLSPPPPPPAASLSPPPPPAHSPSPPPPSPPARSPSPPPPPSPPSRDDSRPATPIRIGPPRGKRPTVPSTPQTVRKDAMVIDTSPARLVETPASPPIRVGPPKGKRPTEVVAPSPAAHPSPTVAAASSLQSTTPPAPPTRTPAVESTPSVLNVPACQPTAEKGTTSASAEFTRLGREVEEVHAMHATDAVRSPELVHEPDERTKRLLALWSGPQKDSPNGVPRWLFTCKTCPSQRTIARNPLSKTLAEERLLWSTFSHLRKHVADKHPAAWALFEQQASTIRTRSPTRVNTSNPLDALDPALMDINDEDGWGVGLPIIAKARQNQATNSPSRTPTPPPRTPPHETQELQEECIAQTAP